VLSSHLSLRRRLMLMLLLTSGVALLLTSVGILAYEYFTHRQAMVRTLTMLGEVVADNSTAALAFYNADDARQVLGALKADPHIVAAALYDSEGALFATYPAQAAAAQFPALPQAPGLRFQSGHLAGVLTVSEGDGQLGSLYLRSDLGAIYERLRGYVWIAALVMLLSLLAAYLISRRLQQQVSGPILALAAAAKAVSEAKDYSRRVAPGGHDELGTLNSAFNHMLDHIQAQLGRLELLNRITRAIGERQDSASIYQVVVNSLETDLPADLACICTYEPAGATLTVAGIGARGAGRVAALAGVGQVQVPVDENGLLRCVRGRLVYEPDVGQVQFAFPQLLAAAGLRAAVFAPLLMESKVSGVLIVARCEPDSFSSAACEFLRQLSEHTALAAHQLQLHLALQQAYDDLRQTQHTVMQQERLRALGQMASGIAHDINNAISPVALYTESLLEREPDLSERARDYLTTIQRAIDDVAETVARMREFYRPREPQLQLAAVNINTLVQQVLDLTRVRWADQAQGRGAMIELRTEFTDDVPQIMGAEAEIRDALTNLVFNAVDAMPEGGTLTVRTRVRSTDLPDEAGTVQHVWLEVADTGVGMSEDTRRRCLEPFFTTKGERGTGLGLPMVYGMVQRHSAEMEIDSAPGEGTTFRLIFPVFTPVSAAQVHSSAVRLPVRPLRILIIDDDPLLTKSLRDTLETDGHQVVAADGGQTGIDTFVAAQRSGEPFAIVITDLGMPYVDGRKVAASVHAASPATPIVMLTGWGQRLVAENDVPAHVDRLLSKPPRLHELRAALAELAAGD
jgi:signal transduction histidine kinase/ActR/RegA family two-component response regulator/HAMP domain-containing protein